MKGKSGENLLQLLELRLDNIVYRLGLASSRAEARQLVTHGHFTVNGKKVNIPSYITKANDVIAVRESSRKSPKFQDLANRSVPAWLSFNADALVDGGPASCQCRCRHRGLGNPLCRAGVQVICGLIAWPRRKKEEKMIEIKKPDSNA